MAGAAVFGKILGIAGGIARASGGFRNDLARATQLRFEAGEAENNAELARQDQAIVAERGAQERAALSKQEQQVRGSGAAGFASGNVELDTGTPLEFDIAQAEQFAAERETSKDNEALQKHRLETERQGLLAKARLGRKASRSQRKSAQLGFAGGVLQSVGGAMGK